MRIMEDICKRSCRLENFYAHPIPADHMLTTHTMVLMAKYMEYGVRSMSC